MIKVGNMGRTTPPYADYRGFLPSYGHRSLWTGMFSGSGTGTPPHYLAFPGSIASRALHRGHCTLTGLADLFRLASRIPIYTHVWPHRWQVRRQLVYWLCMSYGCIPEVSRPGVRPVKVKRYPPPVISNHKLLDQLVISLIYVMWILWERVPTDS